MAVTETTPERDAPPAAPAQKQYFLDPAGNPVATDDPGLAESYIHSGGVPVTPEQAQEQANAAQHMDYVDQNWGAAGKLGMGLASGLTLGLAPGYLVQQGLVDPGNVRAAQSSPLYTAGDIGGMILPSLLSGGEAAGVRGLARMTPAGMLDLAGNSTERLVGSVLGESTGLMGKMVSKTAQMAGRGAVEGAAINLGHTIGDSMIANKPLGAEALLSTMEDGALFGGLIGGSLGTVGSLAGLAADSVGSMAKTAIGRSGAREGLVAKRLGQSAEDVGSAVEKHGAYSNYLKEEVEPVLQKGGVKIGDSDIKIQKGIKDARGQYEAERLGSIQDLDKNAPQLSPSVERINARIDGELIAPRIGTLEGSEAVKELEKAKAAIQTMSPMTETPATFKDAKRITHDADGNLMPKKDWKFEPAEHTPASKTPSGELPTWEKWIAARDHIAQSGAFGKYKPEILNLVDDEIAKAMRDAEVASPEALKGIPDKYAASTAGAKVAEHLAESLGDKAANKLLNTAPTISAGEMAYAGMMAANGSPAAAIAFAAGKGAIKLAKQRLEPALAQMAYDMSIGAKAAQATTVVKGHIKDSLKAFFKAPVKATYATHAERTARSPSRAQYENMASRVEQLTSANHQDKVRRYAESLYETGYPEFAKSLMDANNRTTQYLIWNQPQRQGTKNLGSLRKMPAAKVPTLNEFGFSRKVRGATQPLSVLEDLNNGSLSRDQVQAMKYAAPELHAEVVNEATQQIYETKVAGEFLPMSKITMLGILLDAPVDSTQMPEYIDGVQAALNLPVPNQEQPQQASQPTGQFSQMATDMMTPIQKQGLV